MGFWDAFKDIIKKVPEITDSLKELSENEDFKKHLGQAGAIGGLCVIGLDIVNKISNDLKTPEKQAFASVLKIVFESTKESLPKNDKINLGDIKTEDLLKDLFEIFTEIGYKWDLDLPSHPVVDRFKKHIKHIVTSNPYCNDIDLTKFFIDFRILIEDKVITDEKINAISQANIKPYFRRTLTRELSDNLREYLKHVSLLKNELNPIDHKSFMSYYVENKAVLVPEDTWYKDKEIDLENQWDVENNFLKEEGWRVVIAAPFGIGKTSLAKHIAEYYASKHLDTPTGVYNYIPVFVQLKNKLDDVFSDKNLEDLFESVVAPDIGRNRKILLILDGLDEYRRNDADSVTVSSLLQYIEKKHKVLRNMKVIITTRLEAGLPKTLHIKNYVRLLPFDPEQVKEFFQKYYYPKATPIKYEDIERYGLKEEEIFKPLFCWMLTRIQSEFDLTALENVIGQNAKRSLIYQQFIHSTIIGKHRDLGGRERFETEEELEYNILKEKKILRKIAPLKMMYGDELTQQILTNELSKFEDISISSSSSEDQDIQNALAPIISSYFHLTSSAPYAKIDFIHESFKEYLLAEYYIESLLMDKPYRLNIGIPNEETISFLYGLLQLISKDVTSYLEPKIKRFLASLSTDIEPKEHLNKKSTIIPILINIARTTLENEQIVFHQKVNDERNNIPNELWNVISIDASRYRELWIHRWICMYILSTLLTQEQEGKDNTKVHILIKQTSNSMPFYLKKLNVYDLSYADLSHTDLSDASLSHADLSNADLSYTDLSRADLSHANLARANLNTAKLTGANLKGANLRESNLKGSLLPYDLSYADLSYADLSDAKLLDWAVLTHANLSHASLKRIKFIDVYLREVDLSFADLTDANLICGDAPFDIIGSNLSYANLSGARLTGRYFYLENCDLSNAKLLEIYSENTIFAKGMIIAADFSNATLLNPDFTAADLSNTNLAGASLVRAKFVRTRLTAADLSNARIIECEEYSDLICDQANFDNAFIDNEKLVCYLREHGGKHVPDAVTDERQIKYLKKYYATKSLSQK